MIIQNLALYQDKYYIHVNEEKDTVLTVLEPVKTGETVSTGCEDIEALEDIPQYHKIAKYTCQFARLRVNTHGFNLHTPLLNF